MVRDVIKTVSVKHRMLDPGFGYVRLSQFQARTPEDMLTASVRSNARPAGVEGPGAGPAQQPRVAY